jgi:hypothetical protein
MMVAVDVDGKCTPPQAISGTARKEIGRLEVLRIVGEPTTAACVWFGASELTTAEEKQATKDKDRPAEREVVD